MSKKIFFFDLDGTLIDTFNQNVLPSDNVKQALKQLQDNDHLIFACTGRPNCLVSPNLRALNFDGYICGNGTFIQYQDNILYESLISDETLKKIVTACKEKDITYTLATNTICFTNQIWEDFDHFFDGDYNIFKPIQTHQEYKDHPIGMFSYKAENIPDLKALQELTKDTLIHLDYGFGYVDSYNINHSKATAIEYIAKYFNIPIENTFAFGDGNNDFEMISFAGTGVAMGNAIDELKDIADYVTTSVEVDGVVDALKYFNLI